MSSPAQILANQSNAQKSTGPVTAEGKARVSQNATKLGLFSITSFVRPEEQQIFHNFTCDYMADLSPQTALEQTLAREIIHAAWRLRRCAEIESSVPEHADEQDLDRIQASIDRARTTAQRTFYRALAELRRVQTERLYRLLALPGGFDSENVGQANCGQLDRRALVIGNIAAQDAAKDAVKEDAAKEQVVNSKAMLDRHRRPTGAIQPDSAKQTQLKPVKTASIARNAACPCGSHVKYKRCCGKNAPPVLGGHAA